MVPKTISDRRSASRRQFLWEYGGGLGGVALAAMLSESQSFGDRGPQESRVAEKPPRAKRVVQLFMAGGASHIDLFDFKPELIRRHGQPSDFGEKVEAFQDGLGPWLKPIWEFKPYGESQKMLSDVVSPLGNVVDEISFVHNMVGRSGVHSSATLLQTTGFVLPGFPGMGCWISYGLGNENENLPTFVVLPDHRGFPSNGIKNWDAAFLPGQHGGTLIYPNRKDPVYNLFPNPTLSPKAIANEVRTHELLEDLNRSHAASRPDPRLEARIRSYELAAKMQLAAPEALDWRSEPEHILRLYGIEKNEPNWPAEISVAEEAHHFGVKCLTARRLLERGVRFVQVWSGNDNSFPRRNWDSHEELERDHGPLAMGMATGASALIADLKQRGLLEDTIVLWTTEFGRLPSTQGGKGRDHNPFVFTNWICGGGVRGGVTVGESDQFGFKPADRNNFVQGYDIHATILHLLGIDHTKLTFRHSGADRRLTDVHGRVINELLT